MPAEAALPSFADLQRELSPISPRAWRFAALRACSRAGALLSDGLRIGYRHGFDSGPFMAHVYADRPSGRTAVGRAIDRRLLRRRTCVAFRDIRMLAEQRGVRRAARRAPARARRRRPRRRARARTCSRALTRQPRARAILGDTDPEALDAARRDAEALGVADRVQFLQADAFDRDALARAAPLARRRRRARALRDLPRRRAHRAPLPRPRRARRARARSSSTCRRATPRSSTSPACGSTTRASAACGGCARSSRSSSWARGGRLRAGAVRPTASDLPRGAARARGRGGMTNVLTWGRAPAPRRRSARGACARSRPATTRCGTTSPTATRSALLGLDPDELYPGGTTRLPARLGRPRLADLLPRAAGVGAGGDARGTRRPTPRRLPARPHRAAARGGGAGARPRARRQLRGRSAPRAPRRACRWRCWPPRPRRRGHPRRPRLLPPARRRARGGRRARDRADRPRHRLSGWTPTPSRRRSRRARARSAWSIRSTRTAPCATEDEVAALTALAERHGLLLVHDVTHAPLAIDPDASAGARAGAAEHAVATFSVSHCFGWPARAWASWPARRR